MGVALSPRVTEEVAARLPSPLAAAREPDVNETDVPRPGHEPVFFRA